MCCSIELAGLLKICQSCPIYLHLRSTETIKDTLTQQLFFWRRSSNKQTRKLQLFESLTRLGEKQLRLSNPGSVAAYLQLIGFPTSDEERNELNSVLEEVDVLVHHAMDNQESIRP